MMATDRVFSPEYEKALKDFRAKMAKNTPAIAERMAKMANVANRKAKRSSNAAIAAMKAARKATKKAKKGKKLMDTATERFDKALIASSVASTFLGVAKKKSTSADTKKEMMEEFHRACSLSEHQRIHGEKVASKAMMMFEADDTTDNDDDDDSYEVDAASNRGRNDGLGSMTAAEEAELEKWMRDCQQKMNVTRFHYARY